MTANPERRALPAVVSLALVAALLLPAVPAAAASPAGAHAARIPSGGPTGAAGVVVRMASSIPAAGMALASGERASRRPGLPADTAIVPLAPGEDAEVAARRLADVPGVLWAEPDYVAFPLGTATPTDPDYLDPSTLISSGSPYAYARSWWLRRTGAPAAWARGYGTATPLRGAASSFRVAVIDTGCYLDHPDMGPNVLPGYDLFQSYTGSTGTYVTDGDVTPVPPGTGGATVSFSAHGTAVAAAVAGTANGTGMVGIGQDVEVVPYKVGGIWKDGGDYGYEDGIAIMLNSAVAAAVRRAADDGCRVINLSLGGPSYSQAIQDATDYARSRGAIVVAAAGNEGQALAFYPAANAGVVAVAATGLDATGTGDVLASYSNYGPHIDISAPGNMHWLPTVPGHDADGAGTTCRPGYMFWQGTSMASPVVAGAAAFLWRAAPSLSATQVEARILASAYDAGAPGRDDLFGAGRLDLDGAYGRLVADFPPLEGPSLSLPAYSPGRDLTASWPPVTGTGVSYETVLDGGAATASATPSRALSGLAEGIHTLAVRAVSSAGNWPSGWKTVTVTVDTVAPTVSPPFLAGEGLAWIGSGTGTPCTYEVAVDGTTVSEALAVPHYVPLHLPAGIHSFSVRATDAAGNRSGWATSEIAWGAAPGVPAVRLWGDDRYATSLAASREAFADGTAETAVIVTGENWPDALAAGPLATALGGPLLITPGSLEPWMAAELRRLGASRVVVVGGYGPVPEAVSDGLRDAGFPVSRIAGADRYETAALVSDALRAELGTSAGDRVFLASGTGYADSLSASPLAAISGCPVLLTLPDRLPAATAAAISRGGYSSAVIAGGEGAVGKGPLASLGIPFERVAGKDRYGTSAAMALWGVEHGITRRGSIGIASGQGFPDALVAGPVLARTVGGLLLVEPQALPPAVADALAASGPSGSLTAFGGTGAVSDGVLSAARDAMSAGL